MEKLIETIRLATTEDSTIDAKREGAQACRAILAALEATPGQPLAASTPNGAAPSPLAGLDPGQVLDVVIAKLRSMVPADKLGATEAPRGLAFPFIPIPK